MDLNGTQKRQRRGYARFQLDARLISTVFHLEQEAIEPHQGSGEEELLVNTSEEGELMLQEDPPHQLHVNTLKIIENKIGKRSTLVYV